MRNKAIAILASLAIAVVLGASSARADQITLGDSCTGTLTVTGTVNPSVTGSVSNCFGQWEQGNTTTNLTWALASGTNFSAGNGTDTLTGTIDWINAGIIGGVTVLDGVLSVSSVSGFNSAFVAEGTYAVDISLRGGVVSSGEVLVPEPGTLTLLGTGLLTMAGFLRRKLGA